MEMRQLKYFLSVADELHFGRAAERNFVAQPALSRQVQALEEELGAKLLTRTSRRVELTPEGRHFRDEVRIFLEQLDRAALSVGRMARGETGRLRVLFVGPASQSNFPEALREFREGNPEIGLELNDTCTTAQIEQIREGKAQVGLIRSYYHDLSGLCERVFLREPYVLAVPAHHPLAREDVITMKMLDAQPFIDYPRHYQPRLHDATLAAFEEAGVRPNLIQEANTKLSTVALVAAGMGVSLVPSTMHKLQRDGVVYKPLAANKLPCVKLKLIWRDDPQSPILERFLAVMGKYCEVGNVDEGQEEAGRIFSIHSSSCGEEEWQREEERQ